MDDDKKAIDDGLKLLAESHAAEMLALAARQNAILAKVNAIFDRRKAEKLAGKLKEV